MSDNSDSSQKSEYVNIHGDDVEVLVCEEIESPLVPIQELKKFGVQIFRRTQYRKLSIDDSQFTEGFDQHMLQAAQTYMYEHKITFSEETVVESINKAKQKLTGHSDRSFDSKEKHNDKTFAAESPGGSGSGIRSRCMGNEINGLQTTPQNTTKINGDKISPKGDAFPRERLSHIELKNSQHNVVITFVQKQNVLWIQDIHNASVLLDIAEKVRVEAANSSFCTNYELNKIYLAQKDNLYYRCKVIKFKPFTVFFVDYGNTAEALQLKEVSEELGAIPCQAVKITYNQPGFKPKVGMELQIQIKSQYSTGTYVVAIIDSGSETTSVTGPELLLE